jgi:LPPG:FO 2-phospho-L-lactate transferase
MLASLGHEVSSVGVARMYEDIVDGMVIDSVDEDVREEIFELGMDVHATDAVMRGEPDRERLAREVMDFASSLVRI